MKTLALSIALSFLSTNVAFAGTTLSLTSYLEQVEESHQGIRANKKISEGAAERSKDGELYLAPTLFANYSQLLDKKETANPAFQGSSTEADSYSVGVSKLTNFGLSGKFSYTLMHTKIKEASLIPVPDYYTASPAIDLNFSLLRNGFGSETKAQQELLAAANLASSYSEAFKAKISKIDAENAYWRLAVARKTYQVAQETIARAEKILTWATRRVNLQLGERSDMLQAQASLELRKLEMKQIMEELRAASLAFNSARNRESDSVPEILPAVDHVFLQQLDLQSLSTDRLDVKAAEQQQKIAIANAQLSKEKAKPSLDLFSSFAWNGRDAKKDPTVTEAFASKYPTTAIGIKFSTPLYFGLARDVFSGAEKEKLGAELSYQRKLFEQKQEWDDLAQKFRDAKNRLQLTKSIETIQKVKHENEQARLLRGRTTTYQALLFEQDYAQAQLLSIRTQAEVLRIYAQLKIFQNEKEGTL